MATISRVPLAGVPPTRPQRLRRSRINDGTGARRGWVVGKGAGGAATRVYAVPGASPMLFIVAAADARHHKLNGTEERVMSTGR